MKAIIVMLLMSIASFAQNAHSETSVKMIASGTEHGDSEEAHR